MPHTVEALMAGVSRELDRLTTLASALQDQLSPGSDADPNVDALQNLDQLTQTLRCLSTLLARIEIVGGCRCEVSVAAALSEISLSALARRLQGAPEEDAEFGRWELF